MATFHGHFNFSEAEDFANQIINRCAIINPRDNVNNPSFETFRAWAIRANPIAYRTSIYAITELRWAAGGAPWKSIRFTTGGVWYQFDYSEQHQPTGSQQINFI